MSRIDGYKHKLLGFINCDSDYDFVINNPTRKIAIYQLNEDVPNSETDFDGKKGDIIIGGGSGEAPAMRISRPGACKLFSEEGFDNFQNHNQLFKAFWTPTQSFILGNGFLKSNWTQDSNIEFWLSEQICKLLSEIDPAYSEYSFSGPKSELVFTAKPT